MTSWRIQSAPFPCTLAGLDAKPVQCEFHWRLSAHNTLSHWPLSFLYLQLEEMPCILSSAIDNRDSSLLLSIISGYSPHTYRPSVPLETHCRMAFSPGPHQTCQSVDILHISACYIITMASQPGTLHFWQFVLVKGHDRKRERVSVCH